jgi:OOP family OmpA-OmpF porin
MHLVKMRLCLASAMLALMVGPAPAEAQAFLNEDWVLNPAQSNVYVQTEKLEHTIEKHRFTSLEGDVSKNGDASIKIDLNSIDTGIDLRNVRMRFLLFETFKYPYAVITAKIDRSQLSELASRTRISYVLPAHVDMHGIAKDFDIPVEIERVNDNTVTVSTIQPVAVSGETFDFMGGLGKLSEAMGGIRIVPSAAISFDLTFGSGSAKPALEAARTQRESDKAQTATAAISAEGCATRFTVMSESNAIYFKTGSAELEADEPLLDTGADIAKRCPNVQFQVDGYTDNVGGRESNQRLSEQRAKSVVNYLAAKGVPVARIHSAGYGETRPVAPNDTEANRLKNRRIEFSVRKE